MLLSVHVFSVTEVFDTELIGEGAIATFRHALDHLLTSDCIVVPSLARMYVQVRLPFALVCAFTCLTITNFSFHLNVELRIV